MVRSLAFALALVATVAFAPVAAADDSEAVAIEGAYFLVQDDGFHRVLTFDRGGNIHQTSNQETLIGFATSTGTWAGTAPETAVATVISFNYDTAGSDTVGATAIRYASTFSNLVDGKYQTISGSFEGKTYAQGQHPLSPTEPPVRTFESTFEGERINAR